MIPFSAMISPMGVISFTHHDGRVYQVGNDFPRYEEILRLVRELSHSDDYDKRQELFEISQPRFLIAKSSDGRITIQNGEVMFDGKPAEEFVAKRLLHMVEMEINPEPLYHFMVNLDENPSYHSVKQLYRFMEASNMAITPNGMILAYKRVTNDYRDIYTKTFDNSVGSVVSMPRNKVNDDPDQTCSDGLHVCSMAYLPHYGIGRGNRVVICEIHPRDVVSVPTDYKNAKMRVSRYRVVGELENPEDLLGSSPVMDFDTDDDHDDQDEWFDGVKDQYRDQLKFIYYSAADRLHDDSGWEDFHHLLDQDDTISSWFDIPIGLSELFGEHVCDDFTFTPHTRIIDLAKNITAINSSDAMIQQAEKVGKIKESLKRVLKILNNDEGIYHDLDHLLDDITQIDTIADWFDASKDDLIRLFGKKVVAMHLLDPHTIIYELATHISEMGE